MGGFPYRGKRASKSRRPRGGSGHATARLTLARVPYSAIRERHCPVSSDDEVAQKSLPTVDIAAPCLPQGLCRRQEGHRCLALGQSRWRRERIPLAGGKGVSRGEAGHRRRSKNRGRRRCSLENRCHGRMRVGRQNGGLRSRRGFTRAVPASTRPVRGSFAADQAPSIRTLSQERHRTRG